MNITSLKARLGITLSTLLLMSSLSANTTKVSFGAIDRKGGGRTYTLLLSSIQADKIMVRSSSTLAAAKVQITDVIYSDGVEAVSVNSEAFFTTKQYRELLNVEKMDSYEVSEVPSDCKGPCLVITAEGYNADDNTLEVVFESAAEKVTLVGLLGLPPRTIINQGKEPVVVDTDVDVDLDEDEDTNTDEVTEEDQNEVDVDVVDRRGQETRIVTNDFVLDFNKLEPNTDGSITINRITMSRGDDKLGVYPVPAAYNRICEVLLNSQSAQVLDWKVRKNKGKPSFYLNTDNSLDKVNADYTLRKVTCGQ